MGVYGILDDIQNKTPQKEYAERMLHKVPEADVVNRRDFIIEKAKGKTVLDIGCAGTNGNCDLFKKIAVASHKAYGVDMQSNELTRVIPNITDNFDCAHFELLESRVPLNEIELVIAGEVLEHMSNPGAFLDLVKTFVPKSQLLITVPNAFSSHAILKIQKGIECVNKSHVAWYSWKTLSTLVEEIGYSVLEWHWYNGKPLIAEGLIFLCSVNQSNQETSDVSQSSETCSTIESKEK